jgi:hypothetical protein
MDGLWRDRAARNARDRLMSFPSRAAGVGHPHNPTPLVVGPKGISSQYERRSGVSLSLKVQRGPVPPAPSNRVCNLLAKDDIRAALSDEGEEFRPKIPAIIRPFRSAIPNCGDGEWGAWATSSPNRSFVRPSGKPQRAWPSSNPREEVALDVPAQVVWSDIQNAPFVYIPRWDQSGID